MVHEYVKPRKIHQELIYNDSTLKLNEIASMLQTKYSKTRNYNTQLLSNLKLKPSDGTV